MIFAYLLLQELKFLYGVSNTQTEQKCEQWGGNLFLIGYNSIWGKKKKKSAFKSNWIKFTFHSDCSGKAGLYVMATPRGPLGKWVIKGLCHHSAFLNSPDPIITCLLVRNRPIIIKLCLRDLSLETQHACLSAKGSEKSCNIDSI